MSSVSMRGISVRFGAVQALDEVDLELQQNEIHALVGENGAGKTTLMRVLYGSQRADEGEIELDGHRVRFRSSAEAISRGIGMVSQHYAIIPELTCLENLVLGAEPSSTLRKPALQERADRLSKEMGFEFDWRMKAENLSPAGSQKLEILKLMWRESKVLILDEPTAMLSPQDSEALFKNLTRLAADGATIVVVTHRLPEVMRYCQRVTVLRGGRKVTTLPVAETDSRALAEMIVGRPLNPPPDREAPAPGPPLLTLNGLVLKGSRGENALDGVDLVVRTGECVGVAGVDGNGQRELFETILGLCRGTRGDVILGEARAPARVQNRLDWGLRLIPEDRHRDGVVNSWSLEQNAALGRQARQPFAKGKLIAREGRREEARRIADTFNTKYASLRNRMGSLSGGNQQRFVAARAVTQGGRVILAFQPARGLDLDGARDVYLAIRAACASGMGALIVSFDLDELLEYADRIVVMSRGKILEPAPNAERDRQAIGRLMVGAS